MLDRDCDAPFAALIDQAPFKLVPPPGLLAGRSNPAVLTNFPMEERKSARIHAFSRIALRVCRGLPAIGRDGAMAGGILEDVSLHGIGFLFDQQLYLCEELCIWLPSTELYGQVMRCRRLAEKCYQVGVQLDAPLPAWLLKAALRKQPLMP